MELLQFLPHWYVVCVTFLFGLIMGSFLDVIVCRFHTGKSLNGRSRCMSCGHTLSWYELFPLLSYLFLRGKCTSCGGRIPLRLLSMELLTAGLFVFVFSHSFTVLQLGFGLFLMSLLIVTAMYDIRHMVIPHEFVFAVFLCALAYVGYEFYLTPTVATALAHIYSSLGASFFYFALWLFSKGRWIGLGDAKLAFPLALLLTPYSAFSFMVFSFWIGAVVSICVLLLQHVAYSGKHRLPIFGLPLTMKSEVPFAPFMILAFIVVFFAHADVFALLAHFM